MTSRILNAARSQVNAEPSTNSQPPTEDEKPLAIEQVAKIADLKRFGASLKWLWPDWIQTGVLTAVAAPGGTGKTRFMADLVRRISQQLPWPDGQPMAASKDVRVLWVVSDNHHDEMVSLSEAFGIDENIWINAAKEDPFGGVTLECPEDFRDLERRIKAVKPQLVVIDTVGNATDLNLARQEDAKAFYQPLQLMARRHQTAIACLTHLNAAGTFLGRRVLEKVRIAVKMDKPDPTSLKRSLEVAKSNSKRPATLGVTMGDTGNEYDTNPPVAPADSGGFGTSSTGEGRASPRLDECKAWLKGQLQGRSRFLADLFAAAEVAGFDRPLLYRAKEALGVREEVQGKRKVWVSPDTKPEPWIPD